MRVPGGAAGRLVMFRRKRKTESFDRETMRPVIRSSICTGEKVAGFRDARNGDFHEIMLIRGDADLQEFMLRYGIDASEIGREW